MRSALLLSLLLAVVLSATCFELVFRGQVIALGDIPDQFLPWRIFTVQEISAGRVPLWNRFSFCGAPFLANMQSCVLYPLDRFLDLLLAPPQAQSLGLVLHLILGGVFLLALALFEGAAPWAAFIAALGYALGGFHAIHLLGGNLLTITSSIFLPAHLLFVSLMCNRAVNGQGMGWVPFGAALLAVLQVLSGHAQMTFYCALFTAVFVAGELWRMERGRGRLLLWLAMVVVTATLLTAPQLLPTLEYAGFSSRTGSLPYNAATEFSFGWEVLPSLFLPEYLGTHADGFSSVHRDTHWGDWKNWSAVYVGILPAFGFVSLCFSRPQRDQFKRLALRWGPLLLTGLFLSLGRNNPLYPWVHALPGFGQFRAPSKFLPGFIVPFTILGAVGLTTMFRLVPSGRRSQAIALLTGVFGFFLLFSVEELRNAVSPLQLFMRDLIRSLSFLSLSVLPGVCMLGVYPDTAAENLEQNSKRLPLARSLAVTFLIALSIADLGPYFRKYLVTAPPGLVLRFPAALVQRHLKEGQRVLATPEVPNLSQSIPAGIPSPGGYDPFQVGVYLDQFRKEGIIAADAIPDSWSPPLDWAPELGVGCVLSTQWLQHSTLEPLDREGPWLLYRARNPKPFVEFQPSVSVHPITIQASHLTTTWGGSSFLVEGWVPKEGHLTIHQPYVPGWICMSPDGSTQAVEKANPFWQRVEVEAGQVRLLFLYQPGGWRWGWRLFPLGLIGLLGLATIGGMKGSDRQVRS